MGFCFGEREARQSGGDDIGAKIAMDETTGLEQQEPKEQEQEG